MAEVPRYKSFLEKLRFYPNHGLVTKEEGVDALLKVLALRETEGYFYRGLMRSSYKLFTTGQRYWIDKDMAVSGRFETHHQMYMSFLYHLKTGATMPFPELLRHWGFDRNDDMALLSYLQHAGAPTPLLDFTEDPYVALYFASEPSAAVSLPDECEPDQYFSLVTFPRSAAQAMNREFKNAVERNRTREDLDAGRVYSEYMFFSEGLALVLHPAVLVEILGEGRGQLVNNLNIINQKGLFIYNSTVDIPLMELIRYNEWTNPDPDPNKRWISGDIRCVDIHKSLAGYVRDKLADLDPPIHEKSIFPDPKHYFDNFIAGR